MTANILPGEVVDLCKAAATGDIDRARVLHYELRDINEILFIDTNPVPVKSALHFMGKIKDEVRPPLAPLSDSHRESLKAVLRRHKLI